MPEIKRTNPDRRLQTLIFIGLSLGPVLFAAILYFADNPVFRRFLGSLNPLITVALIALLGIALMSFLLGRGWFAVFEKARPGGLVLAVGLGGLLALPTVLVDLAVVFPRDMNIHFPQSLLFYPAIGYVVEVLFHLLPLSLLIIVLTPHLRQANHEKILWLCILVVSLLEPVYQTTGLVGQYPLWAVGFVALHVLLFNVLQLSFFKRYGFVSMYSFRMAYYLVWHVVWGYVRLRLLFPS